MRRPTVAIIGAGIFGVSCALELGKFCDVVVYEQHNDIMMEGTYGNQYRHHSGYHYPRSAETVQQCQRAEADFNAVWGSAIIRNFPAYYAVAREGSKVTAQEFLAFCDRLHLPYTVAYPSGELLNKDQVAVCVETLESVYGYAHLRVLAKKYLACNSHIRLKIGHQVVAAQIEADSGKKKFSVRANGQIIEEAFDYVVNAMYANHNLFGMWFGFSVSPIEFRLKEIVVVDLPLEDTFAVTIMDGPFMTLVPTDVPGQFTFGDVARSIHEVRVSDTGIPWHYEEISRSSRFEEMREHDIVFMPILKKATYVKSIFSVLPVRLNTRDTDARLTTVTNHGNGCWSVFEGKIITCVSAAKEIAHNLKNKRWNNIFS